MANTINDLRTELFVAIKGIRDGSLDTEKAKLIAELSQVIINSAKVEVDYLNKVGGTGTGFIEDQPVKRVGVVK